MYSQWIPQNLQKRLLLYILQQLSLFSEIDLPNLEEVSLNTIHLKDVLIDSDKVGKLRGCNVRYGKLRNVELSGGMVGGVNFEIDGAEFVVALNLDSLETHQKDVLTLLAQSTADLASTIMFENKGEPDFANELKSDLESSNEGKSPSSGNPKKSAFSGMMSRAVEIALLRLQVTVKNISVKFVSEAADLVLYVKEFQFHSNNGCRHVSVKGISLAVARPNINPGHRNDAKETTKDKTGSEKYTEDDLFDYLPLGATIDNKMFATHGGLSPSCQQLDQIRAIDRFKEVPHDGIMADLVWSDPDPEILDFKLSPRGAGYLFGYDVMRKFCHDNNLVQLIRAHQLCNEGYVSYWKGMCLTIWSAPNYCYRCGNRASILEVSHSNYESKSNNDQGVFPGQFCNVFEASPENTQDTNEGRSVNGINSLSSKDVFRAYFADRPQNRPVEYFL